MPGGTKWRIHPVKVEVLCIKAVGFFDIWTKERKAGFDRHTAGCHKLLNLSSARFQKAVLIVVTQHAELKEIDPVLTKAAHF